MLWKKDWCTLPMTMFSNVHIPLTCLMRVVRVSVTERAGYIARIRNLARVVAKTFVAERKRLGYPLLDEATRAKLLAEDAE